MRLRSLELDGGDFAGGGQARIASSANIRWRRAAASATPQPSDVLAAAGDAIWAGSDDQQLQGRAGRPSAPMRRACVPRQSTCLSMPLTLLVGLGAVPPGHDRRVGFRRALVVFGFERLHFGARLRFQFLELARFLFGGALLFGGLVIQPLLLDRDARGAHAARGSAGSVAACSPCFQALAASA